MSMIFGMVRSTGAGAILSLSLLTGLSTGYAKDFERRVEQHNQSVLRGMGQQDSYEMLARLPGPGRAHVLRGMEERLRDAGLIAGEVVDSDSNQHRTGKHGAEWHLTVHRDGSRIRFRNRGPIARNSAAGKSVLLEDRMGNEELELRGRAFVEAVLEDIVELGEGEAMVPSHTEHAVNGAESSDGRRLPETVSESIVIFSRTVDGVEVVGPGSKVAVLFSADGEVVGFDADWPKYRRTRKQQKVLDVMALRERVAAVSGMPAADEVSMNDYRCGYVDLGTGTHRGADDRTVQTGCLATYEGRSYDGRERNPVNADDQATVVSVADYVPAGVEIVEDEAWPQAVALRLYGDACRRSNVTEVLQSLPAPAPFE